MPTATISSSAIERDCSFTPIVGTDVQAAASTRFSEDFAAFQRVYKAAREAVANGQNPMSDTYNASSAFGTFDHIDFSSLYDMQALYYPTPQFGVEIEFDAGSSYEMSSAEGGEYDEDEEYYEYSSDSENALSAEFYRRGWTSSRYQEDYHAGSGDYSASHQGGWRFEHDGSVTGGEMISPIMGDTTQTWETLRDVINTIRNHGGVATTRAAGAHVHVDTTHLGTSVENYMRLFRLFFVFEDVLFRLAANPHRTGYQRGGCFCVVNRNALTNVTTESSVGDILNNNYAHHFALSTGQVRSGGTGHVEFRLWDATLDPAIMQAQIKLSVALVCAAADERIDEVLNTLEAEPSGSHRAARSADGASANRKLSRQEWIEDTERFRVMIDLLFTRSEDKEQMITLFAMNKWGFRRGR